MGGERTGNSPSVISASVLGLVAVVVVIFILVIWLRRRNSYRQVFFYTHIKLQASISYKLSPGFLISTNNQCSNKTEWTAVLQESGKHA